MQRMARQPRQLGAAFGRGFGCTSGFASRGLSMRSLRGGAKAKNGKGADGSFRNPRSYRGLSRLRWKVFHRLLAQLPSVAEVPPTVLAFEAPASSLSDDTVPPIEEARERSPLDYPGLPLRKPSSRDVSVAEQPPANRHVRADPRRRAPVAEDSQVAQLERSVNMSRSTTRTQSVDQRERKWPRRKTEGPRPGLGLFIFAPPGF
jgi:hypothetical protein